MSTPSSYSPATRMVIKLGTQIVMDEHGTIHKPRLAALVAQCAKLIAQGKQVILVSSGAVGMGRQALGLMGKALSLSEKQACAAVGQSRLMDLYNTLFDAYNLTIAQLLLTSHDLSDRARYLNLRDTLEKLVELKVIPIINENDSVSVSELADDSTRSFGDNDKLSALVASKLGADLLVILTNVDGIYTDNPQQNPEAQKIDVIEGFEQLRDISLEGKSSLGRGGMATKIAAAKIAAISGVNSVVACGETEDILMKLQGPESGVGTWILAKEGLSGRKRWLGLASGYTGVVVVNDGAKKALLDRYASLLPVGVVGVQGDFAPRQVVSVQDESGVEIARGLCQFSSADLALIQGQPSQEIAGILGVSTSDVVIGRDDLVTFEAYDSHE